MVRYTLAYFTLAFAFFILSCSASKKTGPGQDDPLRQKANDLAHKYIITDGHVDLPYRLKVRNFRLEKEYLGIPIQTDDGDFDYVRAKQGGLDVPFMSIYIPAANQEEPGKSKALADELIDMIEGIAKAHPDKFAISYSASDSEKHFRQGLISLPMGMENGAGIEDDLGNLSHFKKRGISYITLTHSRVNLICDSSYDTSRVWNGLSPFGEDVVREMNRVGIMIDISHVSDETFFDVMNLTRAPVIASHSSCRKFTPGFERNMSDEMIMALGKNGGVIQINFGSSFLDGEIQAGFNKMRSELRALLSEKGLDSDDEEAEQIIADYQKANPTLYADVELVADHIDHVVSLAGINHVGLGSDFDGVGDSLPTGLKDVSQYPNLIYVLLKRGYTNEDIEKICYKNVFRVWKQVDRLAKESSGD
jgi:membrane dipeptidase